MSSDGNDVLSQVGNTAGAWYETAVNPTSAGKNLEKVKQTFSGPGAPDANADPVSQVAQLERNINGAKNSGALDEQTYNDLFNQLRGGVNSHSVSYNDQATRIGGIMGRLDQIAAGADPTVNDRQRLNSSLLQLKDRPGRAGLIGG